MAIAAVVLAMCCVGGALGQVGGRVGDVTVRAAQKISSTDGGLPVGVLSNGDFFGYAVVSLGDLNGDQVGDICVTAYNDDDGGTNRGAVYVLFLAGNGTVRTTQKISSTTGGFPPDALDNQDLFGISAAGIGDFDGDQVPDLCVGTLYDDDGSTAPGANFGAIYLLFLNRNGSVHGTQKISNTAGGFPAGALDVDDRFGTSVTALGDVNGLVTDLCVGAWRDDDGGLNRGAVYVLFLNSNGTVSASQKVSSTIGGLSAGSLDNDDGFGISCANVGDLNGDQITDICVGAIRDDDGGSERGAVYILFLSSNGTVQVTQKISSTSGGLPTGALGNGDWFGHSIASVGDVDGDTVTDICVGADRDNDGGPDRGAVYLLFLNSNGTVKASQKISSTRGGLNASGVFLDDGDYFGASIGALGDFDGDSVPDICVGAYLNDDGGIGACLTTIPNCNRGAVYVLFLNNGSHAEATTALLPGVTTSLPSSSTLTSTSIVTANSTAITTSALPGPRRPQATSEGSGTTSSDAGLSVILGIVFGAAVVVLVVALSIVALFVARQRRHKDDSKHDSSLTVELESRSDDYASDYHQVTAVTAEEATQYQNLLRNVAIDEEHPVLGRGAFGLVFRGERRSRPVAIKQIQAGVAEDSTTEFLRELDIMLLLKSSRIIRLYGVCLLPAEHGGGLGLVMELASRGSLDSHLQRAQGKLSAAGLLQIAHDVTEGLAYLHEMDVLHRDLAARNVLVAENGACKLADFGMSRKVAKDETYVTLSRVPIRWTAPEVLLGGGASQAADCYSLAILLWEIFSFALHRPYSEITNNFDVTPHVANDGQRMTRPAACPPRVFALVKRLWLPNPADRLLAKEVALELKKMRREQARKARAAGDESVQDGHESAYMSVFSLQESRAVPEHYDGIYYNDIPARHSEAAPSAGSTIDSTIKEPQVQDEDHVYGTLDDAERSNEKHD